MYERIANLDKNTQESSSLPENAKVIGSIEFGGKSLPVQIDSAGTMLFVTWTEECVTHTGSGTMQPVENMLKPFATKQGWPRIAVSNSSDLKVRENIATYVVSLQDAGASPKPKSPADEKGFCRKSSTSFAGKSNTSLYTVVTNTTCTLTLNTSSFSS